MSQTREQLLRVLSDLSEADPNLRFGQMIINLVNLGMGQYPGSTWEMEDADLIESAKHLIEIHRRRNLAVA